MNHDSLMMLNRKAHSLRVMMFDRGQLFNFPLFAWFKKDVWLMVGLMVSLLVGLLVSLSVCWLVGSK